MAINVSISDKGSDYIARGLGSLGEGIASGITRKRDTELTSLKYLSESEDPADQAVASDGLKSKAGVTQAIENRILSESIAGLMASGDLSEEEGSKALKGNVAKMRETVSTAATNKFIANAARQQAAIEAEQVKGYLEEQKLRQQYDIETAKINESAAFNRFKLEQQVMTEEQAKREDADAKAQVWAAEQKQTVEEKGKRVELERASQTLNRLVTDGLITADDANQAILMPTDKMGEWVAETARNRALAKARKDPKNFIEKKDADGNVLYIFDVAAGEIVPGSMWKAPSRSAGSGTNPFEQIGVGGAGSADTPTSTFLKNYLKYNPPK